PPGRLPVALRQRGAGGPAAAADRLPAAALPDPGHALRLRQGVSARRLLTPAGRAVDWAQIAAAGSAWAAQLRPNQPAPRRGRTMTSARQVRPVDVAGGCSCTCWSP